MISLKFVLEDLELNATREPAPDCTVQVTNLETGEKSPTVVWTDREFQAVTFLMIGEGEGDETLTATMYDIAEPKVSGLGSDFRVIP